MQILTIFFIKIIVKLHTYPNKIIKYKKIKIKKLKKAIPPLLGIWVPESPINVKIKYFWSLHISIIVCLGVEYEYYLNVLCELRCLIL